MTGRALVTEEVTLQASGETTRVLGYSTVEHSGTIYYEGMVGRASLLDGSSGASRFLLRSDASTRHITGKLGDYPLSVSMRHSPAP